MEKKQASTRKEVLLVAGFFLFLAILIVNISPRTPVATTLENPEADLGLSAAAAYVLDEHSGDILYSKNEKEVFEIASITKLMTALVALEEMPGKTIVIDRDSYVAVGDTGLLIDEKWQLENLVSFMLVNSSNDAAEAIAKSYPRGRKKFMSRKTQIWLLQLYLGSRRGRLGTLTKLAEHLFLDLVLGQQTPLQRLSWAPRQGRSDS
jgi:D-alanyl-D-alanine endopeptidase (penicillin-binding protein 7)